MAGVTIRDVAKAAGVSTATVSYVLNNSRAVSEETRRRVLEAAQRLGYRANITARNLQASETRLLGYTWRPTPPDQFNPILDQFLNAIAQAAARHEYHILTFPTTSIEEEIAIYREMVLTGQVDGFVLSNTNLDDPRVQTLLQLRFPFVAFGRSNPEWDFPWVDVDGTYGLFIATRHLLQQGHRRIACLAWPYASLTGQYRLAGYRQAMADAGLDGDPEWVVRTENTYEDAYQAAQSLLDLPPSRRPTAIVALSDLMAIGAMNAAADRGIAVGRELAVVGFDDAPIARFLRPPLSSLRQPIAEVGERLATMLIDLVNGRRLGQSQVLLKPSLVVRGSSAFSYHE
jgi:DNA-binding LacI/PurR family transcriptional regulator